MTGFTIQEKQGRSVAKNQNWNCLRLHKKVKTQVYTYCTVPKQCIETQVNWLYWTVANAQPKGDLKTNTKKEEEKKKKWTSTLPFLLNCSAYSVA